MLKHIWLLYLYGVLSIIEIIGDVLENELLILIFKPLLMLPLIAFTFINIKGTISKLLIFSLIFSWSGDVNLLFVGINENFFLSGLASFLIAHILYIVIFNKESKKVKTVSNKKITLISSVVFTAFYIFLMYFLFPSLGEFMAPVLVYGLVICLMGIFAMIRYQKVNALSFMLVTAGAIIFIISDTTIAINKFIYLGDLPFAQSIIMITYTIAQIMISTGIIRNNLNQNL